MKDECKEHERENTNTRLMRTRGIAGGTRQSVHKKDKKRGEAQNRDNAVAIYAGTRSFERGDIELGTRWRGDRFSMKWHRLHVESIIGAQSAQIGNE